MSVTQYESRKAWLESRRQFIGASESPAILGCGYADQSAWSVWESKVHGREETDAPELRLGQLMEPVIAELFSQETGLPIRRNVNAVRVSESVPFVGATVDGETDTAEGVTPVELKNVSGAIAHEWSKGDTPLKFEVQVQHQLFVTGAEFGFLFALIGGERTELRKVYRNDDFLAAMLERLHQFWELVQAKTPPPIEATKANAAVLARLHPNDNGKAVTLPDESSNWMRELQEAKDLKKQAERRELLASNALKSMLGDATYGVVPSGEVVSWKTQERKGYEVAPSVSRVMRTHKKLPKGAIIE